MGRNFGRSSRLTRVAPEEETPRVNSPGLEASCMRFLGTLTLLFALVSLPALAQPAISGRYVNSLEHGKNQKRAMSDLTFQMKGKTLRMTVHKGRGRKYILKNGGKYTVVVSGKRRVMSAKWDGTKLETIETRYSSRGKPTSADHSTWTVSDDGKKLTRQIVIPPYTKSNGDKVEVPYEATAVYFRKGGALANEGADPVSKPPPTTTKKPTKDPATPDKPPADLSVGSTKASPNTYTGECVFTAVVQNSGGSTATDVRARFVVVGPDGKTWINKTVYRGPMEPGTNWTITEEYKHRLGGQAVTDQDGRTFEIKVTPSFKSAK